VPKVRKKERTKFKQNRTQDINKGRTESITNYIHEERRN